MSLYRSHELLDAFNVALTPNLLLIGADGMLPHAGAFPADALVSSVNHLRLGWHPAVGPETLPDWAEFNGAWGTRVSQWVAVNALGSLDTQPTVLVVGQVTCCRC